ncbi:MAG: murein biosynthesis integral membrane protein MurJ [Patescibacteria group bacterium]|nr:murein biosynthesis integral membrane protein MurJ [Patescibacteria group bacterium]
MERLWRWFNKGWGGLHEAALVLALSALASQLLALIRDRLLAASFGAGRELDIYYAAFRLPDLVYVSIASFISVAVVIPLLAEKEKSGDTAASKKLLNNIFTAFILVMLVVSLILFIVMPWLAPLVAPGFDAGSADLLTTLSRILLLSPFLLGLSNLFSAVTQSLRRFFIYALSPVLYNVGIIIGIVFFEPHLGLPGLAWGVALGALLHLAIQWPTVWQHGFFPRLIRHLDWRELRRVIWLSLPRTLGLGAVQLTTLALVAIASLIGTGAIAVFNFANNLQAVPLAIIGVSYSVAAFPTLVNLFASGERDKFKLQISTAIRHILFWALPATILFIVLRAQIVRVILGSGRFSWDDTRLTAAAMALFIVSLAAQSLVLVLVRAYYSAGQTRRPLLVNVLSAILTILLAFVFWRIFISSAQPLFFLEGLLRVRDISGTAVLALPLAFTLGSLLNIWFLWQLFQRDFGRFPKMVDKALGQSVAASLGGGLTAYIALNLLDNVLDLNTFVGIFTQGFVAGILGLLAFTLILWKLKNKELKEITKSLHNKFWQSRPIAPEPEGL